MTEKEPCLYCGDGTYVMTSKRIGTWTDGEVKTFIDHGTLKTVYEEYDISGMASSRVRFVLSEFRMRHCPICGREINTPVHGDNVNWEKDSEED